ncbi:MAG: hypothetical protein AABM64_03545 [Pseudomonadota bacterium]
MDQRIASRESFHGVSLEPADESTARDFDAVDLALIESVRRRWAGNETAHQAREEIKKRLELV